MTLSSELHVQPTSDAGTFELTGTIEGSCVDFTTRELRADGGELRFAFTGKVGLRRHRPAG